MNSYLSRILWFFWVVGGILLYYHYCNTREKIILKIRHFSHHVWTHCYMWKVGNITVRVLWVLATKIKGTGQYSEYSEGFWTKIIRCLQINLHTDWSAYQFLFLTVVDLGIELLILSEHHKVPYNYPSWATCSSWSLLGIPWRAWRRHPSGTKSGRDTHCSERHQCHHLGLKHWRRKRRAFGRFWGKHGPWFRTSHFPVQADVRFVRLASSGHLLCSNHNYISFKLFMESANDYEIVEPV